MAIGRSGMSKEFFGNRQKAKKSKKMAMGGLVTPTDMMNTRGRDIAAQAQQGGMKTAMSSPSRIVPGGMPPRGMGGMPPRGMGGMPPRGMGGMPPRGMGGMPPRGMGGMPPRGMGGMPPRGMGGMPPRGMGGMPPRGMGGMPPRGMGGMPPRGMSPAKPAIGVATSGGMAPMPPSGVGTMPKGPTPQNMKKGGSVRGCGCAVRGKNGAKVY